MSKRFEQTIQKKKNYLQTIEKKIINFTTYKGYSKQKKIKLSDLPNEQN